jgi:hypothetical protein
MNAATSQHHLHTHRRHRSRISRECTSIMSLCHPTGSVLAVGARISLLQAKRRGGRRNTVSRRILRSGEGGTAAAFFIYSRATLKGGGIGVGLRRPVWRQAARGLLCAQNLHPLASPLASSDAPLSDLLFLVIARLLRRSSTTTPQKKKNSSDPRTQFSEQSIANGEQ